MPVAPVKPLVLAYTELNGDPRRPAEFRGPSGSPSRAAERITDDLSLSARGLKLARATTAKAPGVAQQDEPTAGRPSRRLNLTV